MQLDYYYSKVKYINILKEWNMKKNENKKHNLDCLLERAEEDPAEIFYLKKFWD